MYEMPRELFGEFLDQGTRLELTSNSFNDEQMTG